MRDQYFSIYDLRLPLLCKGSLALLAALLWSAPFVVAAATLSIDPPGGKFGPGDTFMLTVRLDTSVNECINAASVELHYPAEWMKATAVSNGESLFTLWTEEPTVDLERGIVKFEGGIPGGYCGRIQGDPEKTNVLAKVVLSIPGNMIGGKIATGSEPLPVTFGDSTKVLLNDGRGTMAPLLLKSGTYTRELISTGTKNEWLDVTRADVTPPDLFTIALEHDPHTFQGKYFIVFATVDKQSGVHHYEVMEDDPARLGYVRGQQNEKALFVSTRSPYVLRDQTLSSRIVVRALDHAGNIQESILPPGGVMPAPLPSAGPTARVWWFLGGSLVLIGFGVFAWIWYWRRQDKVR